MVTIPFLLLISFAVYYSYSAVRQEVYLRKAYNAFDQHHGTMMLYFAREAESPLKNMDPLANPVASYIGKAFSELNDLPNALIAFREAYRVFPDKLKSIINLAEVNGKLKLYDESEQILKRGLKLYPDHPGLQKQRCDLFFNRGDLIRAYVTLRSIHGWENDSALSGNVGFLENQLGIGNMGLVDLVTDSLRKEELIRNYIARIMNDPAWLEMIRKKALLKAITMDEMIRLDAQYMVIQRFNHYKSTIEHDTAEFATLIKKAINGKKTIDETISALAEIRVEQEIKNGK
jgi:tetratricopeptide (TPR) repeat protein